MSQLDDYLAHIVTVMMRHTGHLPSSVSRPIHSLAKRGGKGLRPSLLFVAAGEPPIGGAITELGAALELIHVGSLLHDDVIDDAHERRGHPSTYIQDGGETAVLAGAACFAAAGSIASHMKAPITRFFARSVDELAEGEILDVQRSFDFGLSTDEYLEMVKKKTGALFGLACRLGAMFRNTPVKEELAFEELGILFGSAFHLIDDCHDLMGTDLGKPSGLDIHLGLASLPVLISLRSEHDELSSLLKQQILTGSLEFSTLRDEIHASNGIEETLTLADSLFIEGSRTLSNCKSDIVDQFLEFARQVFEGHRDL